MIYLYQFILQLIWILKPIFKFIPHKKIQYFFKNEGQIRNLGQLLGRPIWIHASSGEIEYAKSLIRDLKLKYPQIPLLVTHTSISSEKAVGNLNVNAWGVAPLDTPQDVQKFLRRWNPRACLIARTDLWPQTLQELAKAQIPTFLFSATFAKGSKKISYFSRQLLKTTLPLLKKIYFVSSADEMLCKSFFPDVRGQIMGDTRYDQVLFRLKECAPLKLPAASKLLIAGSTWSEDEKVLVPAFEKLKEKSWQFILVPHEVDENHIQDLTRRLTQASLRFQLSSKGLQNFSWNDFDVLVVDQVGVLASLYPQAHLAFVGGSFKRQVHSVMEALAANSPVILGPFHENNREALEFKDLGFVSVVNTSEEFVNEVIKIDASLSNLKPKLHLEIQKHLGSTEKIIQDLKDQALFA